VAELNKKANEKNLKDKPENPNDEDLVMLDLSKPSTSLHNRLSNLMKHLKSTMPTLP
jgi:hypothetical protein